MRRTISVRTVLLLAVALAWVLPARCPANEVYGQSATQLGLYLGNNLLASWRVAEAREVVDAMLQRDPADRGAQALDARVLFFEGRYAASLDRLGELEAEGTFRDLVATTVRVTADFRARESEHFILYWSDPRDELLVEAALEGLERAYRAVEEGLGFAPGGKVRVEIYPTVGDFTAVSTLTREEVRTSGTIGLCKFDRLMITSPRATVWGYPWRDTLSHEYLHLAQYRLSNGTAPIWVHEGIAKYLEAGWRGAPGELDPASRALLVRRMREGTLISLEEMSPSIAKLPSAEDSALAFAEVSTMIEFLILRRGEDAPRRLLVRLADGEDDRAALEAVWGDSFASFDRAWRDWVESLPFQASASQIIALQLAEGEAAEEEIPGTIPDPRAGDYARLGDLLRREGRRTAAAVEYAKAYDESPDSPGIASRHAMGLLFRSRWQEAVEVSERALQLYPDLAVLWHRKGEAHLGAGEPARAQQAWWQVMEINPFHLPARRGLWMAAEALGDEAEAERQEEAVALLTGAPERQPDHP